VGEVLGAIQRLAPREVPEPAGGASDLAAPYAEQVRP
jgi:hypothetical protein